jgi:hypothetical protein
MKTTRKTVTVTGTKEIRTGVLTTKLTNRKRNPVTVEIAFTSSLETKQTEKYFFIDGNTEDACVAGLCEDFNLVIA